MRARSGASVRLRRLPWWVTTSPRFFLKTLAALPVSLQSFRAWRIHRTTSAWYNVVNKTSGLCRDDTGGSSRGTQMRQYACSRGKYGQELSRVRPMTRAGY